MARDKSVFKFKQFQVRHQDTPMKVGTDGVLIGAWAFQSSPQRILDIGTGTGLIALMMAQRFPEACITGIEIHSLAALEARGNVLASPFGRQIQIIESDVLHFPFISGYDAIVSNPPFFKDALRSGKTGRDLARHQDALDLGDLIEKGVSLMDENATLAIILPPAEMEAALFHARMLGLYVQRKCMVYSRAGQQAVRIMIEWVKQKPEQPLQIEELIIYNQDLSYTDAYKSLTASFYLQF
jgi:tRNA1Val (adenine37-N6)-methyltransferase